jgi:biopolymer transport protein ExbD
MIAVDIPRTRRKLRPIVVVSLIDIVFVVILFFLVAGHIEKFVVVNVDLPVADSGQRLDEGPVVVVLGRYDEILINDELYSLSDVNGVIAQQLKINPERIITIKADRMREANSLVDFMNEVKRAGGKNISLVTEAGGGSASR